MEIRIRFSPDNLRNFQSCCEHQIQSFKLDRKFHHVSHLDAEQRRLLFCFCHVVPIILVGKTQKMYINIQSICRGCLKWRTVGAQEWLSLFSLFWHIYMCAARTDGNFLSGQVHEPVELYLPWNSLMEFQLKEEKCKIDADICGRPRVTPPSKTKTTSHCMLCFRPPCFPRTDCLSALCSNLKSIWHSWRRALFVPTLRR